MDKLIKIAVQELGQKEISGDQHNKRIVEYAHEAGFEWVNDDETPWCSIFMNWVAKQAKLQSSGKANARSWIMTGQNVDKNPELGDIVIFWRGKADSWEGHVGIFFGYTANAKRVYCLGGNQGNQVSISSYDKDQILGFRRLLSVNLKNTLPDQTLRLGDTGNDVKLLQDALKQIGIDCGTSDGYYGERTEEAVKQLQSMQTGLKIDGVYGKDTRKFLGELLQ